MNNQELFERAKQIVTELCGGENYKYEVTLTDDEWADPSIDIDGIAGLYWNEFTQIQQKQGYQLCTIAHDPGVRYYADGSGEPPSCDVEDVGEPSTDFDEQVLKALNLAMLNGLREFQQYETEIKHEGAEMENLIPYTNEQFKETR